VADPTNVDPAFRRNRVRHELLPVLDDIAGRDVVPILARQAGVLRDTVDHLDAAAADLDPTDARALAAAPVALARVAVRRWLRACSAECHPPDAAAVERVLEVARNEAVATDVGDGWRVERHAQTLSLRRASPGRHG
jgi:tRNA(Ile)-lysidine synthase